ncbi:unnamed protein product [Penicillium olsonii]|uniref:Uncharacterized protein n=1 Tax=Penicillium olsonii TaxID=99116 RepID=A0A9W4HDA0_PENOL|nr:unnamed protein product [Penicillium olsonii]CAG8015913.1 unnamed protein product [Penicillium olsonii]
MNEIAKTFRALHQPGNPVLLTNVYDAATAATIASLPTAPAVATASYAIAASIGIDDNALTKSQNLTAIAAIASAIRATNPLKPLLICKTGTVTRPSWPIPSGRLSHWGL